MMLITLVISIFLIIGSMNWLPLPFLIKVSTNVRIILPHILTTLLSNVDGIICSAHGHCSDDNTGSCTCYDGYGGVACDDLLCNSTQMWFGNVGSGHVNTAECSGAGTCDYTSGNCVSCGGNWGQFSGPSCESLSCHNSGDDDSTLCSSNGVCLSLGEMAYHSFTPQKELAGVLYDTPWDKE